MTKIYVGNLPFSATDAEVRELFAQHGTVESVSIITDRDTGRPRGFGFVEMSRPEALVSFTSAKGRSYVPRGHRDRPFSLISWSQFMGKGDRRTRRGKIYRGSFGKLRTKDPAKRR